MDDRRQKIEKGRNTPTPLLRDLVDENNPDVVIIALGSNFVYADPEYQISSSIALAREATRRGASCFWVGPPDVRNIWDKGKKIVVDPRQMAKTYRSLSAAAKESNCKLIDSTQFTRYPAWRGDGLHYDSIWWGQGRELARQWAANVFSKLEIKPRPVSAHPVKPEPCVNRAQPFPSSLQNQVKGLSAGY